MTNRCKHSLQVPIKVFVGLREGDTTYWTVNDQLFVFLILGPYNERRGMPADSTALDREARPRCLLYMKGIESMVSPLYW